MSDDALERAIKAGGGLFGSRSAIKIDFSVPEEPGDGADWCCRHKTYHDAPANEDVRLHARAYIWTRADGERLVLDPKDVTVVLPLEADRD